MNKLVLQVFNNSPDETAYFRMILDRENVANSVVMIQPSLISYSFHSGPEAALLDVAAIAADRILLLDSYFTVVIFHGSTIAQWRKAGYHNLPEHQVIFLTAGFQNNVGPKGLGILPTNVQSYLSSCLRNDLIDVLFLSLSLPPPHFPFRKHSFV